LSKTDVDSLFAPKEGSVDAVHSWLKQNGVDKVHTDGSSVNFHTTVGNANKMLNTEFGHFQSNGVTKLRTKGYSLPDDLHQHVNFISPTVYFGKTQAHAPTMHYPKEIRDAVAKRVAGSKGAIDPSCSQKITPQCIKQLYNINYTPKKSSGAKIGFGSFLNQSVRFADLAQYETEYKIPSQNITNVDIANPIDDQGKNDNHGEANLDGELMVSTVGGLPITQFLTGGSPPFVPDINTPTDTNEPYLPYYQYLLSQPDGSLPQVISNSYGDDEQTVPKAYATQVCNLIAKLGMRGITVLESSGDTGVGAGCVTNDGKNASTFMPTFPGSCPYVTIVGGLQAVSPEVAWDGSSGGFSNYFPQPSYQKAAVDAYIKGPGADKFKEYNGKYANFSGRAFPDISAHSLTPDYSVVYNGADASSGGTSAACPVVASIFTLITDALLQAGKKPLGFLNPLLYSNGFAKNLNDITGGAAIGCNGINGQTGKPVKGGKIIPGASWNATEGWDPSTGLGSPDFGKLKAALVKGTSPSPSPSHSPSPTPSPSAGPRARGLERPAVEVRWA
jgi:tripeptidyl-peptidase I